MNVLDRFQRDLSKCALETFPESTEASVLAHLQHEVGQELYNGCPLDELADVGILILQLASKRGVSLWQLMRQKHEVNLRREWGPKNAQGFWEHVKEGDGG